MHIYTGRAHMMKGALVASLLKSLREDREDHIVVVPRQLTLETERMLLDALSLDGSFALQVLTPQRLCLRIFEAAGAPEGIRVDERGRVMLARSALKAASKDLSLYRGYEHRRGFPDRCARQLELFRQAGLTPRDVSDCADRAQGLLSLKLRDLSLVLSTYEDSLAGRFQDGASEFFSAAARAASADFLRRSRVTFYGFDLTPPALHRLIAAVAAACEQTQMFYPVEVDSAARDGEVYMPLRKCLSRLIRACEDAGARVVQSVIREGDADGDAAPELRHLAGELYAFPLKPYPADDAPRHLQLAAHRDPMEECRFAAALCRRLAMSRGWRWSDFSILCRDPEGYHQAIMDAFRAYQVPVFISSARPAARHALSECVLTALKLLENGAQAEDALALLRTGLMPLEGDESDRLNNHIVKYGLSPYMLLNPLRRGSEAEIAALEPVRQRYAQPLIRLRDHLRGASDLKAQLASVFTFLEDIGARRRLQERIDGLLEADLRQSAGESAQVWNRMMGALDQMAALMGPERLSLRELRETLSESLEAAVIKPLPQADDAVFVQPADRVMSQRVKALILIGENDRPGDDPDGLLNLSQLREVSRMTEAWLGSDDLEKSLLRRYYLKSALEMVTDYLCVTWPLSGMDNAAQHPSPLISELREVFPALRARGGVTGDEGVQWMLRASPQAAMSHIARALSEGTLRDWDAAALAALQGDKALAGDFERISAALNYSSAADSLNPATANDLYGEIRRQSISRLEQFARCPFSYFVEYGLKPEHLEPFELNARDEGNFYHSAVHEFLLESLKDIGTIDTHEARARMDVIADNLLDQMAASGPMGSSAVSLADRRRLKATVGTCAEVLSRHMRGSRFQPAELEADFGPEDGPATLTIHAATGECALIGKIDRIDRWIQGNYLRVIDYKRSSRGLDLYRIYHGQSLQLPVYLAAAMRRTGAQSAGVFYFGAQEGIVSTQSTDKNAVEAERQKQFRLDGLAIDDREVLAAQSPDYESVLNVKVNSNGALSQQSMVTDRQGFESLIDHVLGKAAEALDGIRTGEAAVSPGEIKKRTPCEWCDLRDACLFDPELDVKRVHRFPRADNSELMKKMKLKRD